MRPLSHSPSHGEGGAVADGEGHVEAPRDGLRQEGLPAARRAEHDDVGLVQADLVFL